MKTNYLSFTFFIFILSALLLFSSPLTGKLISPSFGDVRVSGKIVHAFHLRSNKLLRFDLQGNFLSEISFLVDGKPLDYFSFQLSPKGHYLVRVPEKDDCKVQETEFFLFDFNGKLLGRSKLENTWWTITAPNGSFYIYNIGDDFLDLFKFNIKSGKRTSFSRMPYAELVNVNQTEKGRFADLTIDSQGNIIFMLTLSGKGIIKKFSKEGKLLHQWEAVPDPVTSVSYMDNLYVDTKGNIYATHGSWEVSSSSKNDGSILKFSPEGKFLFRIKEEIGYLQTIAIANDETIFSYQLGDEIFKFNADGSPALSWLAVPPKFGLSWTERIAIRKKVKTINADTGVELLCEAVVHGDYDIRNKARELLMAGGISVVPVVTDKWLVYKKRGGGNNLSWPAMDLWKKHPKAAVSTLSKQFLSGTDAVKQIIAPYLGRMPGTGNIPGLKEALVQMFIHSDPKKRSDFFDDVSWALGKILTPSELMRLYIGKLKKFDKNTSSSDTYDVTREITDHFNSAFPMLKPLLLHSQKPVNEMVAEIMRSSWKEFLDNKDKVAPFIIETYREWLSHREPFIRNTAALSLIGLGKEIPNSSMKQLLDHKNLILMPEIVFAFSGAADQNAPFFRKWVDSLFQNATAYYHLPVKDKTDVMEKLMWMEMPSIRTRAFAALKNDTFPLELKESIARLLQYQADEMEQEELEELLTQTDTFFASPKMVEGFADLLKEFSQGFLNIGPGHRVKPLPAMEKRSNDAAMLLIKKLYPLPASPFSAKKTCSVLIPLLDSLSGSSFAPDFPLFERIMLDGNLDLRVKAAAIGALIAKKLPPVLVTVLEPYLNHSELSLVTAKALAHTGNDKALDVLINQGMKRMGYYSRIYIDPQLFSYFGEKAEDRLMALLNSANKTTRKMAVITLGQLKSPKAFPGLKKTFDAALQRNELPEDALLSSMMYYGHDRLSQVIDIMVSKKKGYSISFALQPPVIKRLCQLLSKESYGPRAKAILSLVRRLKFFDEEAFESLSKSHPDPKIRSALED